MLELARYKHDVVNIGQEIFDYWAFSLEAEEIFKLLFERGRDLPVFGSTRKPK
jgi:hypothetical protein